jgi:hypothetical protein
MITLTFILIQEAKDKNIIKRIEQDQSNGQSTDVDFSVSSLTILMKIGSPNDDLLFPEGNPDFEGVISYSPMHRIVCQEKPFGDVSAEEYLTFTRDDLSRDDRAGLVNSLGNAKRCFHCHVDRLLYRFGLRDATDSLHFPRKIDLLNELRIVSGTLHRVFNRERNAVEHDYVAPTPEIDEGSVDLCELLLLATERFLS